MIHYKKVFCITLCSFILFVGNGCSNRNIKNEISIAEQYGLAYSPIQIMKEKKILESKLPKDTIINWVQLVNTATIREAMVTNDLDIGFMAIPPFLIGWEKGMDWKIATGLSCSPVGLVTHKENLLSIKDIDSNDRIALPQPGSVQHILLSMAAEKMFSDPKKFDNQLVTMSHPDGMNALISKQDITAHFTAPPYLNQELKINNMHQILSGEEAMGKEFSFIIGAVTKDFYENKPDLYLAFMSALQESILFISENPKETSEILSEQYKMKPEEVLEYIYDINYTTTVKGLTEFSDFMVRNGYLSHSFSDPQEVLIKDVIYEK